MAKLTDDPAVAAVIEKAVAKAVKARDAEMKAALKELFQTRAAEFLEGGDKSHAKAVKAIGADALAAFRAAGG